MRCHWAASNPRAVAPERDCTDEERHYGFREIHRAGEGIHSIRPELCSVVFAPALHSRAPAENPPRRRGGHGFEPASRPQAAARARSDRPSSWRSANCRRCKAATGRSTWRRKPPRPSIWPQDLAKKAGDSFVTAERLLQAIAMSTGTPASAALKNAGVTPQGLNAAINDLRKGRTADIGNRRKRLRCAEEIRPRSHRDCTTGQARSGDRARRGNPPHDPGSLPPHQEQSRPDRRARRRQDRHR